MLNPAHGSPAPLIVGPLDAPRAGTRLAAWNSGARPAPGVRRVPGDGRRRRRDRRSRPLPRHAGRPDGHGPQRGRSATLHVRAPADHLAHARLEIDAPGARGPGRGRDAVARGRAPRPPSTGWSPGRVLAGRQGHRLLPWRRHRLVRPVARPGGRTGARDRTRDRPRATPPVRPRARPRPVLGAARRRRNFGAVTAIEFHLYPRRRSTRACCWDWPRALRSCTPGRMDADAARRR